jgi:hypothetical protein
MTNPDPNRFYDTKDAAILANLTADSIRKILRGKKDGSKTLLAHRIKVNGQYCYYIEKWLFHIWLQNEITRWESHTQHLRDSLSNPEAMIQNGRSKT